MTTYRIKPGASDFLRRKFSTPPGIGRIVEVSCIDDPYVTGPHRLQLLLPSDKENPAAALLCIPNRDWPEWAQHLEEVKACE